jgi:hypothetical protein
MPCEWCLETRKKMMRVFGFTFPLLLVLLVVFIIGSKNPGILARIPVLNKI